MEKKNNDEVPSRTGYEEAMGVDREIVDRPIRRPSTRELDSMKPRPINRSPEKLLSCRRQNKISDERIVDNKALIPLVLNTPQIENHNLPDLDPG